MIARLIIAFHNAFRHVLVFKILFALRLTFLARWHFPAKTQLNRRILELKQVFLPNRPAVFEYVCFQVFIIETIE